MTFNTPNCIVDNCNRCCENSQPGHDTGGVEHGLGVIDEKSYSSAGADILADDGGDDGVADAETQAGKYPGHCRGQIDVADDVVWAGAQDAGVLEQHGVDIFESLIGIEENNEKNEGHDDDDLGEETKPKPQDNERGEGDAGQGVHYADEGLKHGVDLAAGGEEKSKCQSQQHPCDKADGSFGQRDPQVLEENPLVKPDADVSGDARGRADVKWIKRLGASSDLPSRQKEGDKAGLHEEHCPAKAPLHRVPPLNAARVRAQFREILFAHKARPGRGDAAMDCRSHFPPWRAVR